jgi:hypothetical protein
MVLDIKKGEIVVLVIPNTLYSQKITEITQQGMQYSKAAIYISLNRPYDALTKNLKAANVLINKILFIDGITKSANPGAVEGKNCLYVESAGALTKISIILNKVLATEKFDTLMFDSLSTVLIYNESGAVSKFVHSVVNKAKQHGITAIFTILAGDASSTLLKELSLFVDKTINLE